MADGRPWLGRRRSVPPQRGVHELVLVLRPDSDVLATCSVCLFTQLSWFLCSSTSYVTPHSRCHAGSTSCVTPQSALPAGSTSYTRPHNVVMQAPVPIYNHTVFFLRLQFLCYTTQSLSCMLQLYVTTHSVCHAAPLPVQHHTAFIIVKVMRSITCSRPACLQVLLPGSLDPTKRERISSCVESCVSQSCGQNLTLLDLMVLMLLESIKHVQHGGMLLCWLCCTKVQQAASVADSLHKVQQLVLTMRVTSGCKCEWAKQPEVCCEDSQISCMISG